MRTVAYLRVSTDKQTLDSQRLAIENYAKAHSLGPILYAEDPAYSGKDEQRPEFQKLLADPPDVLIVYKLDRLTRTMATLLKVIEKLKGTRIISVTENLDFSTAMGRFMVNMLGSFAEFDRERICERVKAGVEAARENGKQLGRPRHPKRDEAIAALKAGEHPADIARRLDIALPTVYGYKYYTAEGAASSVAKPRKAPGRKPHPRREEAKQMHAEGKTRAEIARILAVSEQAVYDWIPVVEGPRLPTRVKSGQKRRSILDLRARRIWELQIAIDARRGDVSLPEHDDIAEAIRTGHFKV